MMIELSYCVKVLRALTANVLLNLMMSLHMIVEIGNLSKRSSTIHFDADKRTFASMKSSVIIEIRDLCECFTTVDADVRTIICVDSLVVPKVRLL